MSDQDPSDQEPWLVVVDDEAELREVYLEIIDRSDQFPRAIVEGAADGVEGAALICSRPGRYPDIVVCDVQMPHRDGISLLREFHDRTTFIMMSALAHHELAGVAQEFGLTTLHKPFKMAAFVDELQQAMERAPRRTQGLA